MFNKNAKNIMWGYKKITQKSAFTLVELSVVVVIIAIMLSAIIVSRSMITSANLQGVYKDILDFSKLTTLFTNEYGCAPGDCSVSLLPAKIVNATPSACFNLSTTTGMGNAATTGNSIATTTAATTQYIAAFGTGTIDSNAKRTCAFYELQAFEPSGFGGSASAKKQGFNSILGVQNANAIGVGKLDLSTSNPYINNIVNNANNAINTANNTITTANNTLAAANNTITVANNTTAACSTFLNSSSLATSQTGLLSTAWGSFLGDFGVDWPGDNAVYSTVTLYYTINIPV